MQEAKHTKNHENNYKDNTTKEKIYINSSTSQDTSLSKEEHTLKDQSDQQPQKDSRGPTQTPKSQH